MPGFTVQRSGFTRVPELFYAITQDLLAHGFTLVYPSTPLLAPINGTPYPAFKVTLAASASVDPFYASQPWSIQLNALHSTTGAVTVATPLQLTSDGKAALLANGDGGGDGSANAGMLNTTNKWDSSYAPSNTPLVNFIGRGEDMTLVNGVSPEANYPFTYRITVASTGIVVAVWVDASDNSISVASSFQWFCVQRPVDHTTGSATSPATVHAPMFCVFGMGGKVYRFTVRENDVAKPTVPTDATANTTDSNAIMNAAQQVAITESNQYVITFPNGLNTQRYSYTSELDLIAYTSADVVSAYTDVPLTVYGEGTPRTYKALNANAINNTGMRLLMLTAGGPMA